MLLLREDSVFVLISTCFLETNTNACFVEELRTSTAPSILVLGITPLPPPDVHSWLTSRGPVKL